MKVQLKSVISSHVVGSLYVPLKAAGISFFVEHAAAVADGDVVADCLPCVVLVLAVFAVFAAMLVGVVCRSRLRLAVPVRDSAVDALAAEDSLGEAFRSVLLCVSLWLKCLTTRTPITTPATATSATMPLRKTPVCSLRQPAYTQRIE